MDRTGMKQSNKLSQFNGKNRGSARGRKKV